MIVRKKSNSLSSSPFKEGLKSLLQKKVALTVIIILSIVFLVGIFSPLIAPYSYSETNLLNTQSSPSWEHIFGTDRLGRDIFTRIIWGIQTTVIITFVGRIDLNSATCKHDPTKEFINIWQSSTLLAHQCL